MRLASDLVLEGEIETKQRKVWGKCKLDIRQTRRNVWRQENSVENLAICGSELFLLPCRALNAGSSKALSNKHRLKRLKPLFPFSPYAQNDKHPWDGWIYIGIFLQVCLIYLNYGL